MHMRMVPAILFVMFSFLMVSCDTQPEITTYDAALQELNQLHGRYQVDLLDTPNSREAIASMQGDLAALERKIGKNDQTSPVLLLIDFRQRLLESDDLLIEGFKWGEASTTEPGFGCRKGSGRILNSSALRNESAEKGYEAVELLDTFIDVYPERAAEIGVGQKDVLTLNANYQVIREQAQKDHDFVTGFCFRNESGGQG